MLLALGLRHCTFSSQTLDTVANCSLEEEAGGSGSGDAVGSGAVGGTAFDEPLGGTA